MKKTLKIILIALATIVLLMLVINSFVYVPSDYYDFPSDTTVSDSVSVPNFINFNDSTLIEN